MIYQADFFMQGQPVPSPSHAPVVPKVIKDLDTYLSQRVSRNRKVLLNKLLESPNLHVFSEDIMDQMFQELLDQPLISVKDFVSEFADLGQQTFGDSFTQESQDNEIPYEPWGEAWVTDRHGLNWSKEGINFMQIRMLWRAFEELSLHNNAEEKWSSLLWIFRPAIWKHYVWEEKKQTSQVDTFHERDHPFSYHNCCIAARVDGEILREQIKKHVPKHLLERIEKVCTF